ncbi:MAG: site-2 protease family protein [Myxococcales bacterium]|nr:MAG: site-2 protease family protein [Myxococcales bacterium]
MDAHLLATLPLWVAAFLLSLTCHEAAHALVGRIGGYSTAAAQVTLDPMPHIRREPFGTIVVPILSFFLQGGGWMIGWASAPYDPTWANRYPKRAALMAAAGPAANFALTLLAGVAIRVGIAAGYFDLPSGGISLDTLAVAPEGVARGLALFLSVLFSINLILGCFNLIPLPPLDGYAMVPLVLNDRLRDKWFGLFSGGGMLLGLIVAFVVFGRVMPPVFHTAIGLLYTGI